MLYTNPVIPGFHPDPSICRVGEDYYLVTSSFEYFPAVPVFHSRDLVHWEKIGNCLTRKSQLDLGDCKPSGGIWAPTIRYHNGLFYMVVVNAVGIWRDGSVSNFYVTAEDPAGPWSEPIYVDQGGIDPSLLFDDDGKVYFTTNGGRDDQGRTCIQICEIDPATGKKLTPSTPSWAGTGGRCVEAPHLYKINGKYYLLTAEGGTEYGHMATIARSDSPWGPWESCPFNPILTNRNGDHLPIQCAGHADFVETPDGKWYAVCLAVRPTHGQLHHLGRETYLMPIEWRDGWPYVGMVYETGECHLPECPVTARDPYDFSGGFSPEWVTVRMPDEECYRIEDNRLVISGKTDTLDDNNPAALLLRQEQFDMDADYFIDCELEEGGQAGVTVYYDQNHHYEICVEMEHGKRFVRVHRRVGDMWMKAADLMAPEGTVKLSVHAEKFRYVFKMNDLPIAEACTALVSTELVPLSFTGVMYGPYAIKGKLTLVGR